MPLVEKTVGGKCSGGGAVGVTRREGAGAGWAVSVTMPSHAAKDGGSWVLPMGVFHDYNEAVLARDMECFRRLFAASVAAGDAQAQAEAAAAAGSKGKRKRAAKSSDSSAEASGPTVGGTVEDLLQALDGLLNRSYPVRWEGLESDKATPAAVQTRSLPPRSLQVDVGGGAGVWVAVGEVDSVATPLTPPSSLVALGAKLTVPSPPKPSKASTSATATADAPSRAAAGSMTDYVVPCSAPVPPILSAGSSGFIPHDRRSSGWSDAATSVYAPAPNFVFEVSVCHSGSLGISLSYFTVPFSRSGLVTVGQNGGRTGRQLGCLRVSSFVGGGGNILSGVLQPGDLLLKVNDSVLVTDLSAAEVAEAEEGSGALFYQAVDDITSATAPRVLRILRLGSVACSGNVTHVCPAEIQAYVAAPPATAGAAGTAPPTTVPGNAVISSAVAAYQHVSARFTVTPAPLPSSPDAPPPPTPYTIALTYFNPSCPPPIKKMLHGIPFHWRVHPSNVTAVGGGGSNVKRKMAAANAPVVAAVAAALARDTATAAAVAAAREAGLVCGGGVFKETLTGSKGSGSGSGSAGRFMAVLEVAPADIARVEDPATAVRSYCVGRYDSEDEAAYAYRTAVAEAVAAAVPGQGGGAGAGLYVMRGGKGIIRKPPPPPAAPSTSSTSSAAAAAGTAGTAATGTPAAESGSGGLPKSTSSGNLVAGTGAAGVSTPSPQLPQHGSTQSLGNTPH